MEQMKRLSIAAVAAVALLAGTDGKAQAHGGGGFSFGIGIGFNLSWRCHRQPCYQPCCPQYGGAPYCGMAGAPPMGHAAMMPGFGGAALAGYPGFGYPGMGYPAFGGHPMMGGADLGVMRPDMAALALAGAPGYAGFPALVATPMMPAFPPMGGMPGTALAGMPFGGYGAGAFNPAFAQAFHPAMGGMPAFGGFPGPGASRSCSTTATRCRPSSP
jgi:hypothetical protein